MLADAIGVTKANFDLLIIILFLVDELRKPRGALLPNRFYVCAGKALSLARRSVELWAEVGDGMKG